MRFFITTFIIILTYLGGNAQQYTFDFKPGKAVISGQLEGFDYVNLIEIRGNSVTNALYERIKVSKEGYFHKELEIPHKIELRIGISDKQVIGLIASGDSLNLHMNKQTAEILFSGNSPRADLSNDINWYNRTSDKIKIGPEQLATSVDSFLLFAKNYVEEEKQKRDNLCATKTCSPLFKEWSDQFITYSVASYISDYKIINSKKISVEDGQKIYSERIFPANRNDYFYSTWYFTHINNFGMELAYGDGQLKELPNEDQLLSSFKYGLKLIMENTTPSLTRDVMAYRLINSTSKTYSKTFQALAKDASKWIQDKELITLLHKKSKAIDESVSYNISVLDPIDKKEKEVVGDFWAALQKKHEGKVIYIDIYATWCGPCLSEIPKSHEIQKKYERQDIAFVNICMSSDRSNWLKLIEKRNITGDNYFFTPEQVNNFKKKYPIIGYPTYMIVDKTGNMASEDAPKPSSGKVLMNMLDKYLMQ